MDLGHGIYRVRSRLSASLKVQHFDLRTDITGREDPVSRVSHVGFCND